MKNVKTFFKLHGLKLLAFLGALLALSALIVVPSFADSPLDPLQPIVRWYNVDRLSPPDDYETMSVIMWNISKLSDGLTIKNNSTADASWILSNVSILVDAGVEKYMLSFPGLVSVAYDYDIDSNTKSVSFSTRTTNSFTFLSYVYNIGSDTSVLNAYSTSGGESFTIPTNSAIQLFYDPLRISGDAAGTFYSLFGSYKMIYYPSFVEGKGIGQDENYDDGYADGYAEGYSTGYDNGVLVNNTEAYEKGKADAQADIDSGEWGVNLLGETLSAPIRAMNQFVLVTTPSGFSITLGLVVGCVICLTLFIAFLKLFAGG